ncbi:MAG: hypothetical protein WCI05_13485 [Myxococcales bacterium]
MKSANDTHVRKLMDEMNKHGRVGEASMKAGMDRKKVASINSQARSRRSSGSRVIGGRGRTRSRSIGLRSRRR